MLTCPLDTVSVSGMTDGFSSIRDIFFCAMDFSFVAKAGGSLSGEAGLYFVGGLSCR